MLGIPHNGEQTVMVTSVSQDKQETEPLVDFQLELNPLDREGMDVVVKTSVKPLRIVYDEVSHERMCGWVGVCGCVCGGDS